MEIVSNSFFFTWEVALIEWIQSWLGGFGTTLASFFSMFGETLMCVVVLGFLYWCWDKELGKKVGLVVLLGNVINPMIKNVVRRNRPYMDHESIECLKPIEKDADIMDIAAQGYSFPSGHSSNSVAVFTSTAFFEKGHKWLNWIAVLFPLLCGISRFCLGVHYPTDVLCGWILGLAIIALVDLLLKKVKDNRVLFGILLVITLPGLLWCRSNDYYTGLGMLIGFGFASVFEEKYVNFENTRSFLWSIVRLACGGAVFFGLNALLKLPFSSEFLDSGTMGALLVRAARYAVVIFVDMGVYPMAFRLEKKKENK